MATTPPYSDTFSGTSGSALGTIEVGGVAWSAMAGTWTRTSGMAHTTAAGSSNPLAVIDVSWGDVDVSASVSSGGGDCVYFRVVDATNWLRARVNAKAGSVNYGPYVDMGRFTLSPGDDAYHNPAFFNATVFPNDTQMEVFDSTASSYELFQRSKTTTYNYTVVVEKSVAGTITVIGTVNAAAAGLTAVRVVATGSTIVAYLNGSQTSSGTFIDSTNVSATKHGIGRGTTNDLDRSALDNFALTPLNRAPNAPTLTFPAGGVQIDSTLTQRFTLTFSDPDPGDSQSKLTIYYKLTSDTSWTSVTDATPNGWHDFAADTFAAGDYEWQAETYDAAGHLGARSTSSFFTVATPPAGPRFTSPVNNATITQATQVFDWTSPDGQDSYEVRKVADDGTGLPDTATVYFDTLEVVDAAARTITLDFPVNARTEHVQIRVKVGGLWSDWTDSIHPVSYTPPAIPLLSVAGDDTTASITATVTQPTPSGDEPAVVSTDIWRRELDPTTGAVLVGSEIRLATGQPTSAVWTDWRPASGIPYQYQVVSVAANGTSTASAWQPGASSELTALFDFAIFDTSVFG